MKTKIVITLCLGLTLNTFFTSSAFAQAGEHGNGGGDDIVLAGYVAKYMAYHAKAGEWLQKFYSDGTLSQKLSLASLSPSVTADVVMEEFYKGSDPRVKVEFLSKGHKVNERIPNLPDDRICGNLPSEKLIICSVDHWDKAESGIGEHDYSFGAAIFGALDIHERFGVAGQLEQNDGPISQYPISSQILKYRHAHPTIEYDYTGELFSVANAPGPACIIYNPTNTVMNVYFQRAMNLKGYTVINAFRNRKFTERTYDPITQTVTETPRITPPKGTRFVYDYSEKYGIFRRFLKGGTKHEVTLTPTTPGDILRFKNVTDPIFSEEVSLARMIEERLPQCE